MRIQAELESFKRYMRKRNEFNSALLGSDDTEESMLRLHELYKDVLRLRERYVELLNLD